MERRNSKRQRLLRFLKSWRQKAQGHGDEHTTSAPKPPVVVADAVEPPASHSSCNESIKETRASPPLEIEPASRPLSSQARKEEEKPYTLSEEQLRVLFAGAPQFHINRDDNGLKPTASFPWDQDGNSERVSDSVPPREPAFLSMSVHARPEMSRIPVGTGGKYKRYTPDMAEVPNMLSSEGIEPGSVGFTYFLQLPLSDSHVSDLEESQTEGLQARRNKTLLQTNPERIGIRPTESSLIYDRLIEFQDLYEAFQDSPEPMTILNNQSSGDLYANLFSKFMTPPGYNDSNDDPTGLQTQIRALLELLKLKGVWYDFSLVEMRIRLGQLLWSDPEPYVEHGPQPLWTKREILLLQITLSCELLLRLDVFANMDVIDAESQLRIDTSDIREFLRTKTRKIDWDLVLARTFLENISIVRANEVDSLTPQQKSRGLFSLLGRGGSREPSLADIILLPQHQTRQLSGLLHFAEAIQWPGAADVHKNLANKLGVADGTSESMQQLPSSNRALEYSTPPCISLYGTPLQTPISSHDVLDSYFGNVGQPLLNRRDSQALRVPLSPSWSAHSGRAQPVLDGIGGWLSRSFLTGLILPGEAISHFLMSTLLENDKLAISSLGDSATLYGGFTYQQRTWWSKNSIVGRVLACAEGSTECTGWISCPNLPSNFAGWHNIYSEQLSHDNRIRMTGGIDLIAQESTNIPEALLASATSQDLVLPTDSESPPVPALSFSKWELTPIKPDLIDDDRVSELPTKNDIQTASITFASHNKTLSHNLTLSYDVQFITSWPCSPPGPAAPLIIGPPCFLKRSRTETLSQSPSRRSMSLPLRSNHGYEPLLSHPPASSTIVPKRTYEARAENEVDALINQNPNLLNTHPLHKSYLYSIVPVARILERDFQLPFEVHTSKSSEKLLSLAETEGSAAENVANKKKTVLILDARRSTDMELLARAWCAEKGLHAVVGRTTRTCLACCIREARGLNIKIVIRV